MDKEIIEKLKNQINEQIENIKKNAEKYIEEQKKEERFLSCFSKCEQYLLISNSRLAYEVGGLISLLQNIPSKIETFEMLAKSIGGDNE
jgi:hypothetical protein